MNRSFALHFVLSGVLFLSAGRAFGSPGPHQHRIPQTIIVNGQQAEGVTVIQNGLAPTFDCPNPRPDAAAGQSSNGGACFRANTGSIDTARPHGRGAPSAEYYNYAYPDYTYYPEIFFDHPELSYGSGFGHGRHHR